MAGRGGLRVYISCDMEGVAGISDWAQVTPGPEFETGRRLLLEEVNAAIQGSLEAGASLVLVNDSHGAMANLAPERLEGRARYLSGRHKPLYMMEGLTSEYGAVLFVGYHGAVDGPPAILSHTYNPAAVAGASLGGLAVGEAGLNCLVAAHHEVPICLITGDQHAGAELGRLSPGTRRVEVKRSVTRFAASSLHPEEARERIRAAAAESLGGLPALSAPSVPAGVRVGLRMRHAELAELATRVRGVERAGELEVEVGGADRLDTFRNFVAVLQITRGLAAEH